MVKNIPLSLTHPDIQPDDMVRRFFRKARDYKRAYRERDEKTAGAARELVKRYKSHRACPPSEAQRHTYKPWEKKKKAPKDPEEAALNVKAANSIYNKSYHDLFEIGVDCKKKKMPETTDPSTFENWVFYDGDNHTFGIIINTDWDECVVKYHTIRQRTSALVNQIALEEFQNLVGIGVIKWIGEGNKGKQIAKKERERIEAEIVGEKKKKKNDKIKKN